MSTFFITAILIELKKYHIVVLICISLMTKAELYIKGKCYGMWIVSQKNKNKQKNNPQSLNIQGFFFYFFSFFLQYGYEMEKAGKKQ